MVKPIFSDDGLLGSPTMVEFVFFNSVPFTVPAEEENEAELSESEQFEKASSTKGESLS